MPEQGPSFNAYNADGAVAICTLSSSDLLEELSRHPIAAKVAIIGPLETENIGIEQMLTTLLQRPRIRWLIVCGDERRGRYQGQALRCVFESGVTPDGSIVGARSRRAYLKNLEPNLLAAARRQVRLRDLVRIKDPERIANEVAQCLADDPGAFAESVELARPEPIVAPTRQFRLTEHDPQGFFVVLVDRPLGQILVEHYTEGGLLAHRIAAVDAESMCSALIEWGLLSRLDHAAYLGRELMKAELSLHSGVSYRQDEQLSIRPPATA
jgi:tetrahydromethanopterin S-methyltransferase subunit A